MDEIPNFRVQKHRENLARFSFEVKWEAGKHHLIADALSRYPVFSPEQTKVNDEVVRIIREANVQLTSIQDAAKEDKDYQAVIKLLKANLSPATVKDDHPAKLYTNVWHSLSYYEGLIVKEGSRLVIPKACRKDILQKAHKSHCGMAKTKMLLNELYYWPGINCDAKNMIESCSECNTVQTLSRNHKSISYGTSRN